MEETGTIIYKGPSLLDDSPIVVIATGLGRPSKNTKTGEMVQTWIMRSDIEPHVAVRTGDDVSVCGNCPLRGKPCYVLVKNAPLSVYRKFKRGGYKHDLYDLLQGQRIRLGSYGDPAAMPLALTRRLASIASHWTGYTHQWKTVHGLRDFCMASVDSEAERVQAIRAGWRTFRVSNKPLPAEVQCPEVTPGSTATCATCNLCKGAAITARSISIPAHGIGAKYFA